MSRSRTWAITIANAILIWMIYVSCAPGLDFMGGYRDLVLGADLASPDFLVFAPPWLSTILTPFVMLPERVGFSLFLAFSVAIIVFSTHALKGHPIPLLLSAQLSWILWWGQIDGLAILGLALAWIAYQKKSWVLMSVAFLLVLLKPQVSLIPFMFLWWWLGKERWKTATLSAILLLLSVIIWGPWPLWSITKVIRFAGQSTYGPWNTSLGVMAFPLFIPAIFLPLKDRSKRLLAISATALLVSPYMPYYSTLVLFCFPLPWGLYSFAFLGYFPSLLGTEVAWKGITFLPILTLLWIYQAPAMQFLQRLLISRKISIPTQMQTLLGFPYSDESGSTD
jgi:hypothetical protein